MNEVELELNGYWACVAGSNITAVHVIILLYATEIAHTCTVCSQFVPELYCTSFSPIIIKYL